MFWSEAVRDALNRLSKKYQTRVVTRIMLLDEELARIVIDTGSRGRTPAQTLSRVLQELSNVGELEFIGRGRYLLTNAPIDVEEEDMSEEAIDIAIKKNILHIGIIKTDDSKALVRGRLGQSRLRSLTLQNYNSQCAFCDVSEDGFLVAGHISRWADDPEARGNLHNMICLCRFHDSLFEVGYISLSDDFSVLKKKSVQSKEINQVIGATKSFRAPKDFPPAREFLRKHRKRVGFEI